MNQKVNNNNKTNSGNSLVFCRWPKIKSYQTASSKKKLVSSYRHVDGVDPEVGDEELDDDLLVPVDAHLEQLLLGPGFEVVLQKEGFIVGG